MQNSEYKTRKRFSTQKLSNIKIAFSINAVSEKTNRGRGGGEGDEEAEEMPRIPYVEVNDPQYRK